MPFQPDWDAFSHFVAYTLKDKEKHNDLYIAFHASQDTLFVTLPHAPFGKEWIWLVNTAESAPDDFLESKDHHVVADKSVKLIHHSAIVLMAQDKV